jgi:hypothetical protein
MTTLPYTTVDEINGEWFVIEIVAGPLSRQRQCLALARPKFPATGIAPGGPGITLRHERTSR